MFVKDKSTVVQENFKVIYNMTWNWYQITLKKQCHISHIFYFFIFLLFYEFLVDSAWLKHINCIIFTFFCIQETTDVRRNHCNSNGYIPPRFSHSPCFKYIVYRINSFALIVAQFPSTFVILLLFYHPEISNFRPCSPSFEGAILDSELENVGPTLSNYTMRRTRCAHGDTAALITLS